MLWSTADANVSFGSLIVGLCLTDDTFEITKHIGMLVQTFLITDTSGWLLGVLEYFVIIRELIIWIDITNEGVILQSYLLNQSITSITTANAIDSEYASLSTYNIANVRSMKTTGEILLKSCIILLFGADSSVQDGSARRQFGAITVWRSTACFDRFWQHIFRHVATLKIIMTEYDIRKKTWRTALRRR